MKMETYALLAVLGLLGQGKVFSAGWPQFRGPDRNGISAETDWAGDGSKVAWTAEIGLGFSSFSVANGRVVTTGHADDQDTVFCFDATKGSLVWKHSYPADLGDKYFEGGTSGTPTIHDGKVYHLSRWGDVFCFDAAESLGRAWDALAHDDNLHEGVICNTRNLRDGRFHFGHKIIRIRDVFDHAAFSDITILLNEALRTANLIFTLNDCACNDTDVELCCCECRSYDDHRTRNEGKEE